jgi:hypothetical protein
MLYHKKMLDRYPVTNTEIGLKFAFRRRIYDGRKGVEENTPQPEMAETI